MSCLRDQLHWDIILLLYLRKILTEKESAGICQGMVKKAFHVFRKRILILSYIGIFPLDINRQSTLLKIYVFRTVFRVGDITTARSRKLASDATFFRVIIVLGFMPLSPPVG